MAGKVEIWRTDELHALKLVGAQLRLQRLRMKVSPQAPRLNRAYFFFEVASQVRIVQGHCWSVGKKEHVETKQLDSATKSGNIVEFLNFYQAGLENS